MILLLKTEQLASPDFRPTDTPPGIETPDKLETSIGILTSVDGVPDAATTQKVYDQLDLNRATEAFLNCIPM